MTLPLRITEVSYFDNAYRGDLIITRGVLYYFPWGNVALEENKTAIRRNSIGSSR